MTGATGNVGAEVVGCLAQRGASVVAAVRNIDRARRALGERVDYVTFDFAHPETFDAAFAGIRNVFLVRPPDITNTRRFICPVVEAARRAGVEHVVFLSLQGVERNPVVPHYAIEQCLQSSGMSWTMLRAGFFMQNLNTTHRDDIRDGNDIFVPAGFGKTSFIDVRDIAAVAALALTESGHKQQAYTLTGGAALDYDAVARLFTEVLGRPIRYSNPSPLAFIARMRARGYPLAVIAVMLAIYTTARFGWAGAVTPDTERLLGRPPITMRQYIEDYRDCWM